MDAEPVLALLATGFVGGFWAGRRWAERARAMHDIRSYARKTWAHRSQYREDDD